MMRFNAFGVYFLFRGVPVHVPCEMRLYLMIMIIIKNDTPVFGSESYLRVLVLMKTTEGSSRISR